MKYLLLFLLLTRSVFAQTDTFVVESNYLYVIKASIKSIVNCNINDVYSVAEIGIDSILHFQDSLVMKNHDFFKKNAKYVYFDENEYRLIVDSTYYLNIFLHYQYLVFGIKQLSQAEVIIHENETHGYSMDYPLGPIFYYERRKLKEFLNVKVLGRKAYYKLPKHKTHKIKKYKKPKFLNCIDDV